MRSNVFKRLTLAFLIAASVFAVLALVEPFQAEYAAPPYDPEAYKARNQPRIIAPALTGEASAEETPTCELEYSFPGQPPGRAAILDAESVTEDNRIIAYEVGNTGYRRVPITVSLWGIHTLPNNHERHDQVAAYLRHAIQNHGSIKLYTVEQIGENHISAVANMNGQFLNTHLVELGLAIPDESNPDYPISLCISQAYDLAKEHRNGIFAPTGPPKLPPPGNGNIG